MDEIRDQSEEISETSETRNVEQQSLDDATLEPGAHVEQSGDFKEAEEIQEALVDISATASTPDAIEGATPLPMPESNETGGRDEVSATPITLPIPEPSEIEQGDVIDNQQEGSINPIPNPGGGDVTDSQQEGSISPIPIPGQGKSAGDTQTGLQDAIGDASSEVSEPLRELNYQKPILQKGLDQQDTSQEGLQDLDGMLPGMEGANIEGMPGDGFGHREPGSDLTDMPGFGSGSGKLSNDPGGPEMPPDGLPDGGEVMGGSSGGSEGRYNRAKEMANMGPEPLKYDPAADTIGPNEQIDPFNDFGEATASDYDEREKDQKAFEKARVDALNEMQKQAAAKAKTKPAPKKPPPPPPPPPAPKSNTQETSPVGDGGGYSGSTDPNPKYNPDLISQTTADDMSGDPGSDSILPQYRDRVEEAIKESKHSGTKKAGAEVVTDPPEDAPPEPGLEKGKDAADKPG